MFSRKVRGGVPYFAFDELDSVPGLVHAFTSRETDSAREDAETPAEVAASKPYLLKALGLPGPASSVVVERFVLGDEHRWPPRVASRKRLTLAPRTQRRA